MKRHILSICLALLCCVASMAQQKLSFSVLEFEQDVFDISAKSAEHGKKDGNGSWYAIIKVTSNNPDDDISACQFNFGNMASKVEKHDEALWVYVQRNAKIVTITRPGYHTILQYDLQTTIEAGANYKMVLTSDRVQQQVVYDVKMQMVKFVTSPVVKGAMVMATNQANGTEIAVGVTDENGVVYKAMDNGKYTYRVMSADNMYHTSEGIMTLTGSEETHEEKVMLRTNYADITLTAADNAEILINNEKKGCGTWQGRLTSGTYVVTIKLANHKDCQQRIVVEEGVTQNIQLNAPLPIVGTLIVNSKPYEAEIVIDGKNYGRAPRIIKDIMIGKHNVTLRKDGHGDYFTSVTVLEGQKTQVDGVLPDATSFRTTVPQSTDKTIFPSWVYEQDNTCLGVSAPCSDVVLAKKHALANAFMLYLLNTNGTKITNTVKYDLAQQNDNLLHSNIEIAELLSLENISYKVIQEYYNNRGEYIVRCEFANDRGGKCSCNVKRVLSKDKTSASKLSVLIENDSIILNVEKKQNDGRYNITVDGKSVMSNLPLKYNSNTFVTPHRQGAATLYYDLTKSFGETTTSLMLTLPWLPMSFNSASVFNLRMESGIESGMESRIDKNTDTKFLVSTKSVLKPIGFIIRSINQDKLVFALNEGKSPYTYTDKPSEVTTDSPFIFTNIPSDVGFNTEAYINMNKNVWKQLIAHSVIYDKCPVSDNNTKYISAAILNTDEHITSRSCVLANTSSDKFEVLYTSLIPRSESGPFFQIVWCPKGCENWGEDEILKFKMIVYNNQAITVAKKETVRLEKEMGWKMLSNPLGSPMANVLSSAYMLADSVFDNDGNIEPQYIVGNGLFTSENLLDACVMATAFADNAARLQHATVNVHNDSQLVESESIRQELHSPSWGFNLYRKLNNGKYEVQATLYYDRTKIE